MRRARPASAAALVVLVAGIVVVHELAWPGAAPAMPTVLLRRAGLSSAAAGGGGGEWGWMNAGPLPQGGDARAPAPARHTDRYADSPLPVTGDPYIAQVYPAYP
jgi:hypothetical protein